MEGRVDGREPHETHECAGSASSIVERVYVVCGFSFAERYGDLGEGFIQVHQLKQMH